MKKILMLILCLGMTFAFAACGLFNDMMTSDGQTESLESIDASEDSSEDSSEDIMDNSSNESFDDSSIASSEDSSDDSLSDSSEESSSVAPPIIDGENEMPLVPIG